MRKECPGDALDILDRGVRKESARTASVLSTVLHPPGTKRVMLFVFARMLDSYFGEDSGFKSTKHCITKDDVRFDINQCPYCKYLMEISCPEIIRFACKVDGYIYGNKSGLEFARTGTLGKDHPAVIFA